VSSLHTPSAVGTYQGSQACILTEHVGRSDRDGMDSCAASVQSTSPSMPNDVCTSTLTFHLPTWYCLLTSVRACVCEPQLAMHDALTKYCPDFCVHAKHAAAAHHCHHCPPAQPCLPDRRRLMRCRIDLVSDHRCCGRARLRCCRTLVSRAPSTAAHATTRATSVSSRSPAPIGAQACPPETACP
jgi:hypothetical protein